MEAKDYVRGSALSESEGFALIESFYTSKSGAEAWYRGLGMSKHTNFDYGLYDGQYWWHANHAHKVSSPMKIYKSTLENYSRDLYDFNMQVFIPAISTLPKQNLSKQKSNGTN